MPEFGGHGTSESSLLATHYSTDDGFSRKRSRGLPSSESLQINALPPPKKVKMGDEPGKLRIDGDTAQQLASYALEQMAGTYGTRLHCLAHIVKDDKITPWYFDASGMICSSESLSLIHDFDKFAAFVVGLATCTPEQHGALPESVIERPSEERGRFPYATLSGCSLSMHDISTSREARVRLGKQMFTQYSLVGRRTSLYSAKVEAKELAPLQNVVVKFSYQVCTRTPEQDFVKRARKAGVRHLPEIHMTAELYKLSNGMRQAFFETTHGLANYEDRVLRGIMYRCYQPLDELFAKNCKLVPVMVAQMIDCLEDLRLKANLLHRDISVHNIMYEVRDNKYHFVLIDFDMAAEAVRESRPGESTFVTASKNRTGTLPFMARELIKDAAEAVRLGLKDWIPITHFLRHDLESLFFVSIYCLASYVEAGLTKADKDALREAMLAWERPGKLDTLWQVKNSCCMSGFTAKLSPATRPLRKWLAAWTQFFSKCNEVYTDLVFADDPSELDGDPFEDDNASELDSDASELASVPSGQLSDEVVSSEEPVEASFDNETLNGRFTPGSLRTALQRWMPLPVDVKVTKIA